METTEEEEESLNEDEIQAQEQPYLTPARLNYEQQTKQMWTKEIAKRSDIMITSTLSMSLFPKDKRLIDSHFRYEMDPAAVHDFVDERNAFKALLKQHTYQAAKVRDKDKELRDNYVKSFFHRSDFESKALKTFKRNVVRLN